MNSHVLKTQYMLVYTCTVQLFGTIDFNRLASDKKWNKKKIVDNKKVEKKEQLKKDNWNEMRRHCLHRLIPQRVIPV